jgi:hypothetical protein
MADNEFTVGEAYAFDLKNKWIEIMNLSEAVREELLEYTKEDNPEKRVSSNNMCAYISKITKMWGTLYPMLKNRSELNFKSIAEKFVKYQPYYFNPQGLQDEKNKEDLWGLELVLGDALHTLKITDFGK